MVHLKGMYVCIYCCPISNSNPCWLPCILGILCDISLCVGTPCLQRWQHHMKNADLGYTLLMMWIIWSKNYCIYKFICFRLYFLDPFIFDVICDFKGNSDYHLDFRMDYGHLRCWTKSKITQRVFAPFYAGHLQCLQLTFLTASLPSAFLQLGAIKGMLKQLSLVSGETT